MPQINGAPAPGAETTISISNVRHVYRGGTVALDGVDLEIGRGLFGLLGPNGAGKSTLMRIVCTLLVPSEGKVRVAGHDVVTERQQIRGLLGYLPQEFGAWRLHRVEEVLDTLARSSGLTDSRRRAERVAAALDAVGLTEVASRKVKKLSGGMVRRLGVAQALVHEPALLVVDEPTVGLDPEERIRFRELMANLARERTILLSTHIVADLGSSCRDLALLDGGRIVFRGSPEKLVAGARGRVFDLEIDGGGGGQLPPECEEVSRTTTSTGVRIRAVAPDRSLPAASRAATDVSLEEAYLAFMLARGRGAAVQVEEA